MPTLQPFDQFYADATNAVVTERTRRGEVNLVPHQIEKVIRSYVWLGLNKQIQDWTYNMTQQDQNAIINAVQARTQNIYLFTPSYARVGLVLQLLEDLSRQWLPGETPTVPQSAFGSVNPIIARPRYHQEQYEAGLVGTGVNFPAVFRQSVEQVFNFIKGGLSSVASGLGISPGMVTVVGIILFLLLFTQFTSRLPGYGRA